MQDTRSLKWKIVASSLKFILKLILRMFVFLSSHLVLWFMLNIGLLKLQIFIYRLLSCLFLALVFDFLKKYFCKLFQILASKVPPANKYILRLKASRLICSVGTFRGYTETKVVLFYIIDLVSSFYDFIQIF